LATFKNEIDLHIENLSDHPQKIQKGQILSTQLRHFEEYMDRAIRLGAERVFIIHGLGEGKLRDAVAKRLAAMPEVKSFVNDYHPLYGYGATEVVL
jgi:dsDNA-specific endonuclease/ATPase MutS2